MTFQQAVENTANIATAYRTGLRALRRTDRRHITAEDTGRISGSVDLESALQALLPNAPRWDYGVGHRPTNGRGEMVYWIEIHPANSGEIKAVLAKLNWLKNWLQTHARDLHGMKAAFVWVSSGKTTLSPTAPQRKKMALVGLQQKGHHFRIPNEAK